MNINIFLVWLSLLRNVIFSQIKFLGSSVYVIIDCFELWRQQLLYMRAIVDVRIALLYPVRELRQVHH